MNNYLDEIGLRHLLSILATKEQLNAIYKSGNTEYWQTNSDYIPKNGELIIVTDLIDNKPSILIGDGENTIFNLESISASMVERLQHSITIGDHVFDGSSDVVVDIYKGETNSDEIELTNAEVQRLLTNMSNVMNQMTMVNDNISNEMSMVNDKDPNQMTMVNESNTFQMKLEN